MDPECDINKIRNSISTRWTIVRRKTSGYELDISTDNPGSIEKLKDIFDVQSVINLDNRGDHLPFRTLPEILDEVTILFSQERYWEAHEFLEYYWKLYAGKEKLFIHGLILISVSMVKHQMGQIGEALTVYARARNLLEKSESQYIEQLKLPFGFTYPLNIG